MSNRHPKNATLELPNDLAIRWDVISLGPKNPQRAFAAALGVCWVHQGRPGVPYNSSNPAAYAGQVINKLLEREGVSFGDILEKGGEAFNLIAASVVSGDEVDNAAGNSDAGTEGATPA